MRTVQLSVIALLLAVTAPAALAHRHAAHATDVATQSPAVFPADAQLRVAMDRVRNAVEAFEHARHGHMGPEQVRALTDHLDAQVTRVFKECRLEPRADASMHVILATIAKASRAMRAKPGDFTPVAAMERALADYARMFNDPVARGAQQR